MDYAAEMQARGHTVWQTPQVLPWSTYLRDACLKQRTQDGLARQLLNDAQAMALWEEIIAASSVGQALLNPIQAARAANRSWQRLHQYQIPLAQIASFPSEEAQTFGAWAQSFVERTQTHGWLDSARFASFLLGTHAAPNTRIALMGFDRTTPEMDALLAHWQKLGCEVDRIDTNTDSSSQRSVCVVAAHDAASELEDAARWARAQLEAGKTRIAVIVPNLSSRVSAVSRVFETILAPDQRGSGVHSAAQAFAIAASTSLARYPLVHSALLALQVAQGGADSTVIGQLLRSPFFAGAEIELTARALADVRLRRERHERWDLAALERWAGANHCPVLSLRVRAVLNELSSRAAASPSVWSERFNSILLGLGWSKGRVLASDEQQTLRKFREVLASFGALDEVLGRLSFAAALSHLRSLLTEERFAPETADAPVTIIDPDTVAGMRFDAVWVLGLHANEWPAAPDPDAFIPIELQRKHGIPEAIAESCLAAAQTKLQRLATSATDVVLSWPERDDDAELRPSPLLAAWPAIERDALLRSTVVTARESQFAKRPQLESIEDIEAPSLAAGEVRGGARILELQSRCPFRAQAELRLHAEALETVTPGVAADERGTLVHRVLAEVWAGIEGSSALQALSTEQLMQRVSASAERQAAALFKATTTHGARLVSMEVHAVVQWVLALLLVEQQRPAFRVQRAEQSEYIEIGGLSVRIQPDRVDELANGRFLLIDYKTGTAFKASQWLDAANPGRPASPQLPLYALAHADRLAALAFAIVAPGTAEYRGFGDAPDISPGIAAYGDSKRQQLYGVETWEALLQHWHEVLTALAYHYRAGEAEVDPLYDECRYCDLATLCRVSERSDLELNEDGDE
jgi:ATP-dependent helicase/nuclease subunit B